MLVSVVLAGVAQAATVDWDNAGAGDNVWTNVAKWSIGKVPGTDQEDSARILLDDTVTVDSAVDPANAVKLQVRNSRVATALTIGADMSNLSTIELSKDSSAEDRVSTILQTGGTVTVDGSVDIGEDVDAYGVYQQDGGTLTAVSILVQTNGTYLSSGGAVTTSVLNVSLGGTYNLNGGSLTLDGDSTIDGIVTIDGGTFTLDTFGGSNDITVIGSGLLQLQSGTWTDSATGGGDLTFFYPDVEISGGEVALNGQNRFHGGQFKVIGNGATINIERINRNGEADYVFELNAVGVSTITCDSYLQLEGSTITVDGANYEGEDAVIDLFASGDFSYTSSDVTVTNFLAGTYVAEVVQNQDEGVQLIISATRGLRFIVR